MSPPASGSVLLSDGYAAYASYAKKTGLTHAQCWAHTRREFFEADSAIYAREVFALKCFSNSLVWRFLMDSYNALGKSQTRLYTV